MRQATKHVEAYTHPSEFNCSSTLTFLGEYHHPWRKWST